MKNTKDGYAPVAGAISEAALAISDMQREDFPEWSLYEMSPLLDSSDMTVKDWNEIAGKPLFFYRQFFSPAKNHLLRPSAAKSFSRLVSPGSSSSVPRRKAGRGERGKRSSIYRP